MGIEIRPSGEAQAYAGAGRVIGKAKAREIAREEAQRAQELAFRQRAQQMSNDWELQKMLLNSQLDFQHEQRMIQIEQEKFEKAKAWDVEKMELASRLDFQMEEQKTQKQISIIDNDIDGITKYIKDNGIDEKSGEWVSLQNKLSELDEQKRNIKLGLKPGQEYGMKPAGWQYLTPEEQKQAARIGAGLEPRAAQPEEVKPIFTPAYIQKVLGVLSTGSPESPLGIPLQTLQTKEEHEKWAEKSFGPNWKTIVPEAIDVINEKFGTNELKPINSNIIQQFLIATGGNIEEAKKLAKQNGYKVD